MATNSQFIIYSTKNLGQTKIIPTIFWLKSFSMFPFKDLYLVSFHFYNE